MLAFGRTCGTAGVATGDGASRNKTVMRPSLPSRVPPILLAAALLLGCQGG